MDFVLVAVLLFLPAGVAAHRLATACRFPVLSWWILAAAIGQVTLPAALFSLFSAGVPAPTAGHYLAGFFELAFVATACFALMWGLFLALVILCIVHGPPATT